MKIILSRKGFDGANGGIASPILPDGHMLSLPIPDEASEGLPTYEQLFYGDSSYADLISNLSGSSKVPRADSTCHVDPDLSNCYGASVPEWQAAFGQIGAAQGYLRNSNVEPGDIFLFFGWFRKTEKASDGTLHYSEGNPSGIHAIFGYMQVGDILTKTEDIQKYSWHPHAAPNRLNENSNALYVPSETLSLDTSLPGYGLLDYHEDRVLTAPDQSRSRWSLKERAFLSPDNLINSNRKDVSEEDNIVSYQGIFQELVYNGTSDMLEWVRRILRTDA